jgi:hypothetical protein
MTDPKKSAEELFGEALGLPPDRRSAFLDHVCHDEPELRLKIEEFLLAKGRVTSVLE